MKNPIDAAIEAVIPGLNELNGEAVAEKTKLPAGRTPLFYESMTKAVEPHSKATIRVWRKSAELPEYNDMELQIAIAKIPITASMKQVFGAISALEGVTAIELTDADGIGAIAYYEWP